MPAPKAARIAAILTLVCAAGVIAAAAAGSTRFALAGGVAALIGAVAILIALSGSGQKPVPQPAVEASETAHAERAPRKRSEGSVLLATLRNPGNGPERVVGDLQRVLAGIVADERGAIDRAEGESLVASFSRSDHARAAVHAAHRMLSNVDAVSRRLGHDLKIAIGVHSGVRGADMVEVASRVQAAATDTVPVLVSDAAARHLQGALERVDTLAGEGWSLDVFTFPPAQKRLPGF
jgi:hypothetical protein